MLGRCWRRNGERRISVACDHGPKPFRSVRHRAPACTRPFEVEDERQIDRSGGMKCRRCEFTPDLPFRLHSERRRESRGLTRPAAGTERPRQEVFRMPNFGTVGPARGHSRRIGMHGDCMFPPAFGPAAMVRFGHRQLDDIAGKVRQVTERVRLLMLTDGACTGRAHDIRSGLAPNGSGRGPHRPGPRPRVWRDGSQVLRSTWRRRRRGFGAMAIACCGAESSEVNDRRGAAWCRGPLQIGGQY